MSSRPLVVDIDLDMDRSLATAYRGERRVGTLEWNRRGVITWVETVPRHKRRGVASQLWHAVRAAGVPLSHAPERTDDGQAWAMAVGGRRPRRVKA